MAPNYQNPIEPFTLTIGSAGTLSGSVYLNGNGLVGIANAGTWTASVLTFRVSLGSTDPNSGGTWLNVFPVGSAGTEYSIPAAALGIGSSFYPIPPADLPSVYWLQAKSGTQALADANGTQQSAARSLTIFSRPL